MNLLILAIIGAVLSSPPVNQNLGVGSSCSVGTPTFQVNSFTITPWPITNQQQVGIVMNGTLSAITYLNQIWISSTSPGNLNNQAVPIALEYDVGPASLPFNYTVESPPATWNVLVTLRDPTFNILTCWSFSYTNTN